jgi:hypothetical protein
MSQNISVEFNPITSGVQIYESNLNNPELMSAEELVNECTNSIVYSNTMPKGFIALSEASKAFREATTATIITETLEAVSNGADNAIDDLFNTFAQWLQRTPNGTSTLKTLTEYAASIAFALERKDFAVKVIKRSAPAEVGPTIWTIVDAIKKGMPGVIYQQLVLNNKLIAMNTLQQQQQSGQLGSFLK